MSSGVGWSRVSIPTNVRKLIQNIREITGKQHSDDEIFSVLQDCSMDPNETAQKLLHLDTFHEVKRRRDRRKENLDSKPSEESRPTTGAHRRVARGGGGQGNFSSDAGGGRNAARRENGANHTADRGPTSSKTRNNATPRLTKASTPSGTSNLPNGSSHRHDVNKLGAPSPQPDILVTSSPTFGSLGTGQGKSPPKSDGLPASTTPTPIAAAHSSSDSIAAVPPLGALSKIECEGGSQQLPAESNLVNGDKNISDDIVLSESEKGVNGDVNTAHEEKIPGTPKLSERSPDFETSQPPSLSTYQGNGPNQILIAALTAKIASAAVAVKVSSQSASELNVSDGKQVTFPNHFQVPETLKNGLTFGSFDTSFGPKVESVIDHHDNVDAAESSIELKQAANGPSSSNQNASPNVQGDNTDNSQSFTDMLEKLSTSEANVSSSTDSKGEHSIQETQLPLEGPLNPASVNWHHYGLGIMPPMVSSQVVQVEGHESQSHDHLPNFPTGNSLAQSTTTPATPVPNSIALSPQSVPVFRQTYPPNFFPYGQYISPFYMPPMHHFLSPNGFPPQPSTGNVYLPPAGAGVKFSVPQYKPGNNAGNPTHIGIQSGGSFITAPVGYAQPVTSGSSVGNEDLVSSHLKENRIYTTGQLSEGVWYHAGGQDISSLQVNSLYNLPPQHLAFSPQQPGHGAFAGIFPPTHAMTAPSTLLQQSQAMAGVTDAIGPPSGAYQQPQHAQMNWNSTF